MKLGILRLCFSFMFVMMASSLFSHELKGDKLAEIKTCLTISYGVDELSLENILSKIEPHMDDVEFQKVLTDFIKKSGKLNIQFEEEPSNTELVSNDGVLVAPEWHEILFESPFVRILWQHSKPLDWEPFHRHQWRSIMLILQGAEFEIENLDGIKMRGFWPMGVYELPPDAAPEAYTNLGPCDFLMLRFEIK